MGGWLVVGTLRSSTRGDIVRLNHPGNTGDAAIAELQTSFDDRVSVITVRAILREHPGVLGYGGPDHG